MNFRKKLCTVLVTGSLLALPHFANATNPDTIAADNMADFESQAISLTETACGNWYPGTYASGYISGSFPDSVVYNGGCYDNVSGNLVHELDWYLVYEPDGTCDTPYCGA